MKVVGLLLLVWLFLPVTSAAQEKEIPTPLSSNDQTKGDKTDAQDKQNTKAADSAPRPKDSPRRPSPTNLVPPLSATPPSLLENILLPAARTGGPVLHRWSSFRIEGNLVDPPKTLEKFLLPHLRKQYDVRSKTNLLTTGHKQILEEFVSTLGYDVTSIQVRSGVLILQFEPVIRVRQVAVNVVDQSLWQIWKINSLVFRDEIERRMRLRPGTPLARDKERRILQLQVEAERIAGYLRQQGFGDAEVTVSAVPLKAFTSKIEVTIYKKELYYLGNVTVTGNTAISDGFISSFLRHRSPCFFRFCLFNEPFSQTRMAEDLLKLKTNFQEKGYPGVRMRTNFDPNTSFRKDTKTVEFQITVSERRQVDILFVGNTAKENDLRKHLTFNEEGSYDDLAISESAQSLRRYYQVRGYFEAMILWKREKLSIPNRAAERITFFIDEGPVLRVNKVAVEGNKVFTSNELKNLIKTQEYRSIAFRDAGGYTTSIQLEQDTQRIKNKYKNSGYLDATVQYRVSRNDRYQSNAAALAASIASERKASGLFAQFVIEENKPTLVRTIQLSVGKTPIDKSQLINDLQTTQGGPYVPSRLPEDTAIVKRFFFQLGYPRAQVTTTVEGADTKAIDITFAVDSGPKVRFGETIVRGNFKTKEWVVRDQLNLSPGETMTLLRVERARRELRDTGLFRSAEIHVTDYDDNTTDVANLRIGLQEAHDNIGALELGGGYTSDFSSAFLEAKFTQRNIGGIGIRHRLRGQVAFDIFGIGRTFFGIEQDLTAPRWISKRLLGLGFETKLDWFARQEETVRFGDLFSGGVSLSLSKEWRTGFFRGLRLTGRTFVRVWNRDSNLVRTPGPNDDIQQIPLQTRTEALELRLTIDKRRTLDGASNPLAPETGFLFELSGKTAYQLLFGDNTFIKIGGKAQHFGKIGNRILLTNHVRYHHGIPLAGARLLPDVERYFAGGDLTVRGFEEDHLLTEVIQIPAAPLANTTRLRIVPAGGNVRFLYNADLQVNFVPLAIGWLAAAGFWDAGVITNSLDGVSPNDLRHSLGLGLRYAFGLGSLSLEYAIPLNPQIGDNPLGRAHFRVGLLF